MNENKLEQVKKVLGEPVFVEMDEKVWRTRSHLLTISSITISIFLADLHIGKDSTFLGLRFDGLNDLVISKVLLFITCYLMIHFLWSSWDSFLEWRLRITGTRTAFLTGTRLASPVGDYPNDPRQSTLANWWVNSLGIHGKRLEDRFGDILKLLESGVSPGSLFGTVTDLQSELRDVARSFSEGRIEVSLKRFDRWHELFCRSQNLRWLLFDLLFPLLLSGYAIALLWPQIFGV